MENLSSKNSGHSVNKLKYRLIEKNPIKGEKDLTMTFVRDKPVKNVLVANYYCLTVV